MQRVIEYRIGAERKQDRRRVGKPGRLNHDTAKPLDLAGMAPLEEGAQGARQVLAYSTAETPARQFEHATFDKVDEVVIDRDFTDFVNDYSCVGKSG